MTKNLFITNGIILFYILQRLSEMLLSTENEKWNVVQNGLREVNKRESLFMKIFHSVWFISLIIESNIRDQLFAQSYSIIIYALLFLCLIIRIHSMKMLKRSWNIKILAPADKQYISINGLYQYIRHPNYTVVIVELILIPLLFSAYYTLFIFSLLNMLVLKNRIMLEEKILMQNINYRENFMNKKRFIPFVFSFLLLISYISEGAELIVENKNYAEAKNSHQFIKFESTSTKLGFITTSFNGYAKNFKINYELIDLKLNQLSVTVKVSSLDTDQSSRDEKMQTTILEMDKFPNIIVTLEKPLNLQDGEQKAILQYQIKDKKFSKEVQLKVEKKDGKIFILGSTQLSLKELSLPDPSIVIAKVRDLFDLSFYVGL